MRPSSSCSLRRWMVSDLTYRTPTVPSPTVSLPYPLSAELPLLLPAEADAVAEPATPLPLLLPLTVSYRNLATVPYRTPPSYRTPFQPPPSLPSEATATPDASRSVYRSRSIDVQSLTHCLSISDRRAVHSVVCSNVNKDYFANSFRVRRIT